MDRKFNSIVDMFEKSVAQYASRDLFGEKKDGAWTWLTYADVKARVDACRGGLAALGVGRGDRVSIIAGNRSEWAIAAHAAYGLGAAFVPMYEQQHAEEWEFILDDCQAKVLVCSSRKIFDKVRGFADKLPSLAHVVCLEGDGDDSWKALLAKGKAQPVPVVLPEGSDTSGLIYTSGTTGKPKGVLLSHDNISMNVSSVHALFPIGTEDRSLSFLPWAHSFGQTCELHAMLSMGAQIAVNSAVDQLIAELAEVRPTLLFSVPRIFNRIYDGVQKQMAAKSGLIQGLFKAGLAAAAKERAGQPLGFGEGLKLSIARKLIFSKIVAKFGGRLKYAFSGGAALSKEVAEFIDGLGIMVYEGYGLTETSPIATANSPKARKIGSVGKPIPGVTITIDKLATGDEKHGEVVVHGHCVMQGYHNRPDENAAVMTPDGGFRTGDMGYVDAEGFLYITGRIKEQYKLENGKYVVPAPLEEQLKLSPFIINVMIHGANKPYNVALVVPDPDAVRAFAKEAGIAGELPALCKDEKVRARVQADLDKYSAEFRQFDRVKKFALIPEDFTQENGLLTPSLKLKRRVALERYGAELEKLYE